MTGVRWVLALLLLLWAAPSRGLGSIELGPCSLPDLPAGTRCGTYEVFENRDTRKGRKLRLQVAVLPALGPERKSDPIAFFDGGPGQPSIAEAAWLDQNLGALRRHRDILLVDARGTGGSAPLSCDENQSEIEKVQGFLDDYMPVNQVRACRDLLRRRADLPQYTTARIVDDMAEVATALGYGKLNLAGTSYGTRAVLIFLRRHPERVRTATIFGVLPTDARVPLFAGRHAQEAMETLFATCARQAACARAFPDLRADLAAVLRRVGEKPVPVTITDPDADPKTERKISLVLTREGVAQTLRSMLYGDFGSARLPMVLHRAAGGDFSLLGEMAWIFGSAMTQGSRGLYLSVTCAEDVAFIREEDIAAAVPGTFLGDFRIRRQIAACAEWPAARLGREFLDPVVSDVPVLALSGERDPTTPPAYGERVIRHLRRGRLIVVPGKGHAVVGAQGTECVSGLIARFVEDGAADHLDTSCIARMPPLELLLEQEDAAGSTVKTLDGSLGTLHPGEGRDADEQTETDLRPARDPRCDPWRNFRIDRSGEGGGPATGLSGHPLWHPLASRGHAVRHDRSFRESGCRRGAEDHPPPRGRAGAGALAPAARSAGDDRRRTRRGDRRERRGERS
jgi:pimeloyl-ACP methyl ester carboxylesterase